MTLDFEYGLSWAVRAKGLHGHGRLFKHKTQTSTGKTAQTFFASHGLSSNALSDDSTITKRGRVAECRTS